MTWSFNIVPLVVWCHFDNTSHTKEKLLIIVGSFYTEQYGNYLWKSLTYCLYRVHHTWPPPKMWNWVQHTPLRKSHLRLYGAKLSPLRQPYTHWYFRMSILNIRYHWLVGAWSRRYEVRNTRKSSTSERASPTNRGAHWILLWCGINFKHARCHISKFGFIIIQ